MYSSKLKYVSFLSSLMYRGILRVFSGTWCYNFIDLMTCFPNYRLYGSYSFMPVLQLIHSYIAKVTFTSLTVVGTVRSTFSSCLKPIVIASTTTINELLTVARCCIVEVTGNSCPAGSSHWLKSTPICCILTATLMHAFYDDKLKTYTSIFTALSCVKSICVSLTSAINKLLTSF